MARRSYLLIPSALVVAAIACGGVADPNLFSNSGTPGSAGAAIEAGSPAIAGNGSTPAHQAGDGAVGGSISVAGSPSGGSNTSGGHNAGGAGATSGSAGSAGHTGGSGAVAGSGGSVAGSGGSVAGSGGSVAGSGGSIAGSGGSVAGSGGSGGREPTCQELLSLAAMQLEAARSCNIAMDAQQCTGKVKTTCNCEVPVERQDSAETQAYQATLKQINARKCTQICPAVACIAVNRARCYASSVSATAGSCASGYGIMPL